MKLSNETTECLSNIVAQHPFFATYLYNNMELREDVNVYGGTAATNGKTITVNPEWFGAKPIKERVFVMCHEIMHGILDHPGRSKLYHDRGFGPDLKPYDHKTANDAQDYIINAMLREAGIGEMPEGGLWDTSIATGADLSDEIYVDLNGKKQDPDSPNKDPSMDGSNPGDGNGSAPSGGGDQPPPRSENFDQHLMPSKADTMSPEEHKTALSQAVQAAEGQGNMPASIKRAVGEFIEPKVDWEDQFRNTITARAGHDTATWQRANRRRLAIAPHIYLPGKTGFQMGGMLFGIDVSGSINQPMLTAMFSEAAGILNEVKAEWIKVATINTDVTGVYDIEYPDDLLDLDIKGGGGTTLENLAPYLVENDIYPDQIVMFTDGVTSYSDHSPFECDITWMLTTERRVPKYGNIIQMD